MTAPEYISYRIKLQEASIQVVSLSVTIAIKTCENYYLLDFINAWSSR